MTLERTRPEPRNSGVFGFRGRRANGVGGGGRGVSQIQGGEGGADGGGVHAEGAGERDSAGDCAERQVSEVSMAH